LRKEARLLLGKATDSLVLSIEHFNRPWDRGRVEAVLILLDHSFEMLLKAAILERGGRIREPRAKQTIGFGVCLNRALSSPQVKFLTEEQALVLQMINSLRDAAHHHLVHVSELLLYTQAQAGVTLFRDVYLSVFSRHLADELPERVLPISTSPPTDLAVLFGTEVNAIRQLLQPSTRRRTEAEAKLRALAIVEGAIAGEQLQPSAPQLRRLANHLRTDGLTWDQVFPGVASTQLTAEGTGPSLALRLTKREGIPIHTVPEGTPGAVVVGIERVNELDFYNLGRDDLARHLGLTGPKTTALIWYLNLKDDDECYKRLKVRNSGFDAYSHKAIHRMREALEAHSIDGVWETYKRDQQNRRRKALDTEEL
jgi:hypothetical protein